MSQEFWLWSNRLASINENTELDTLNEEQYGRFKAAVHAYADSFSDRTDRQVDDDMSVLNS